jgi:predicted amidohydrolase
MKKGKMLVGLAQMAPALGDADANLDKVLAWVGRAKRSKASLLVFPELALSGYFVKDLVPELALKPGSPALEKIAQASRGLDLLVGGILEDGLDRFFNAVFFFRNGRLAGIHRKIYLPTYGLFDESRYFDAGSGVECFESSAGTLGTLVCEDAWHPALGLALGLQGAGLLCIPSSSPARGVLKSTGAEIEEDPEGNGLKLGIARTWRWINRSTALTLGAYVLYCNRVGFEDGVAFWGGSEVVDPLGNTVARASLHKEDLCLGELDFGLQRRARVACPLLRDENMDLDARLFGGLAALSSGSLKMGKKS